MVALFERREQYLNSAEPLDKFRAANSDGWSDSLMGGPFFFSQPAFLRPVFLLLSSLRSSVMPFAFERLKTLDRDRLVSLIEPVLRAHGVVGVELIWKRDDGSHVLYVTIERPDATEPAAGVTLDLCSEVSRDISAALDVADVIKAAYRLDVGSPGLDRTLYSIDDFRRFKGSVAKIKMSEPIDGEFTLRGPLSGVSEDGTEIAIDADIGSTNVSYALIERAQLVLDMPKGERSVKNRNPGHRRRKGAAAK